VKKMFKVTEYSRTGYRFSDIIKETAVCETCVQEEPWIKDAPKGKIKVRKILNITNLDCEICKPANI
jgi:hypothetical protein